MVSMEKNYNCSADEPQRDHQDGLIDEPVIDLPISRELNKEIDDEQDESSALGCRVPSYILRCLNLINPFVTKGTLCSEELWKFLVPGMARGDMTFLRYLDISYKFQESNRNSIRKDSVRMAADKRLEIHRQMESIRCKFGEGFNPSKLQHFESVWKHHDDDEGFDQKDLVIPFGQDGNLNAELVNMILSDNEDEPIWPMIKNHTVLGPGCSSDTSEVIKSGQNNAFSPVYQACRSNQQEPRLSCSTAQENNSHQRTRLSLPKVPEMVKDSQDFRYADVTLSRVCVLLNDHMPRGWGLDIKGRHLKDIEWKKILQYAAYKQILLTKLSASDWMELLSANGIISGSSGEEIMAQFYSIAIPNIRDLETNGQKTSLRLEDMDKYTYMAIYHGIEEVSYRNILRLIDDMRSQLILKETMDSQSVLKELYMFILHSDMADAKQKLYTLPIDLETVQNALITDLLDIMEQYEGKL